MAGTSWQPGLRVESGRFGFGHPVPRPMTTSSRNDYLLLGLLALIWSTSFILIKIGVASVGPFTLTSVRLWVAAAVLMVLLLITGRRLSFSRQTIQLYLVIGLLGNTLPFSLISLGEVTVSSSMAAVLMGIMPISTFVLAHIFIPAEPMSGRKLFGVLMGFSGLIALVGMSALGAVGSEPLGQLAVLSGALCYSLSAVYVRQRGMSGSVEAATGVSIVAALASVPLAFWLEDPTTMQPSVGAIWATLALGAIHTAVAALIYFRTIRSLGAVVFAQINYLIPVLGSIWGVLLLGESLGWRVVLSLGLVLGGIYFVQPRRTARSER